MSNLETDLRNALAREEPSPDFAERVANALPSQPSTLVLMPRRPARSRMWLAAAATFAIGAGTLWYAVLVPGTPTDIVSGVNSNGAPASRTPIFEGGSDRPIAKPTEPPTNEPPMPDSKAARHPRVRRVGRVVPTPSTATMREQDAQAFLAARQLRLALTITSEKLRVAQRGVIDRSEFPAG